MLEDASWEGIITCSDNAFLGFWIGIYIDFRGYEKLWMYDKTCEDKTCECKRQCSQFACLKRGDECHLGCSLKKMWGGERMRSYSGLWDRQTYWMLLGTECLCSLTTLDWVPGALHRYTPSRECVIVACNDKGQVTIHSRANGKKKI